MPFSEVTDLPHCCTLAPDMSDDLFSYECEIDDRPAFVVCNLRFEDDAPRADLPVLMTVSVPVGKPDEDGIADDEELHAAQELWAKLAASVGDAIRAESVGFASRGGKNTFFFYSAAHDSDEAMLAVEKVLFGVAPELEIEHREDAEWDVYFDILYPSEIEFRFAINESVIESLVESGDTLETPRPVTHTASFLTAAKRAEFRSALAERDFTIATESEDSERPRPFGVEFVRESPVDPTTVHELTLELTDLAETHDGDYDGWSADVVTE